MTSWCGWRHAITGELPNGLVLRFGYKSSGRRSPALLRSRESSPKPPFRPHPRRQTAFLYFENPESPILRVRLRVLWSVNHPPGSSHWGWGSLLDGRFRGRRKPRRRKQMANCRCTHVGVRKAVVGMLLGEITGSRRGTRQMLSSRGVRVSAFCSGGHVHDIGNGPDPPHGFPPSSRREWEFVSNS